MNAWIKIGLACGALGLLLQIIALVGRIYTTTHEHEERPTPDDLVRWGRDVAIPEWALATRTAVVASFCTVRPLNTTSVDCTVRTNEGLVFLTCGPVACAHARF